MSKYKYYKFRETDYYRLGDNNDEILHIQYANNLKIINRLDPIIFKTILKFISTKVEFIEITEKLFNDVFLHAFRFIDINYSYKKIKI